MTDIRKVYKSASNCIVELEIDFNSAMTNLDRSYVVDANHAKFRCSKAFVVKIYNKFTNCEQENVYSDYDKNFIYNKGCNITTTFYNFEKDIVCTDGIHFYLTKEAAYFHDLDKKMHNGTYMKWYENGQIQLKCNINNGNYEGLYEEWYHDGTRCIVCNYNNNNKLDGLFEQWYMSGKQYIKCNYKNGKLDVLYKE
jgi:antitoxin component YwqK of YwqJK toxin-antitoxin module